MHIGISGGDKSLHGMNDIDYGKLSEYLKPEISSGTFQEFFTAFLHKQIEKHAQEKALEEKQIKSSKLFDGISVFIGNLPFSATDQEIGTLFSQAGSVTGVRIMFDHDTKRPRGYGFCDFDSYEAAERACQMFNGYPFGGRILVVNLASKK